MSTTTATIDGLLLSLAPLNVRAHKMFGEYVLYLDEKVVALVADDQVYVKVTPASSARIDAENLASPYPGAKLALRVPDRQVVDGRWLQELLVATAAELPAPKPKKRRQGNGSVSV